jgi:transcriptional regulator with XRE-family HTH domain
MSDEQIRRAVGRSLRAMREAKGFSQAKVASTLGTTQATVSRWESGAATPDAVDIAKLATVYETATLPGLQEAIKTAQALLRRKEE